MHWSILADPDDREPRGGEMRKLVAIITVLQLGGVFAQDLTPDLLERFLVRLPDLIMRHQRALQLTEEQKEFMIGEGNYSGSTTMMLPANQE